MSVFMLCDCWLLAAGCWLLCCLPVCTASRRYRRVHCVQALANIQSTTAQPTSTINCLWYLCQSAFDTTSDTELAKFFSLHREDTETVNWLQQHYALSAQDIGRALDHGSVNKRTTDRGLYLWASLISFFSVVACKLGCDETKAFGMVPWRRLSV